MDLIYVLHDESLLKKRGLKKRLKSRTRKYVSIDTIIDLAEEVLSKYVFTFRNEKHQQKMRAAIGTKFSNLHSILFMEELEE